MNTNWQGESAKILPFPAGGRRGLTGRRPAVRSTEELEASHLPKVSFGDAWYHDDAMKEEQKAKARKH